MKSKKHLTLADVKIIAAGCESEAVRQNWAVTIAIADEGGHLLWLQRLDGHRHRQGSHFRYGTQAFKILC